MAPTGAAMQKLDWRVKAEQCRHLARIAAMPEVRDALNELAREFEDKAAALSAQRGEGPGIPDESH